MDTGWAAVVAAVIAGAVGLMTVLGSRGEPRALKELKALNDVIRTTPKASAARASLQDRRDRVAARYGADPLQNELKALLFGLSIGFALITFAAVLPLFVGPAEVIAQSAPLVVARLAAIVGAGIVGAYVVGSFIYAAITVIRFARAHRERRRLTAQE